MNVIILILGLLSAFGPLSIDMYLPSLPSIAKDFQVPLSSVQMSLASFFVGIALGQIFYGPVTDRFGRKKPLYFGLILYGLASLLCATTDSVNGLIFFRFLQALGSCAGMVISRAVVRDLFPPHECAKIFSLLMLIMGVAPILAPVIGGTIASTLGWRYIFWILTTVSVVILLAIFFFLQETHRPEGDHHQLNKTFHNYAQILKDRNFTGYAFSMSFIYAGLFAYITGSPFVFIEHYGLTPHHYAWVFGINAFGIIFFSQVNGRLLRRYSPAFLIKRTLPLSALATFFVFLVGYTNGPFWAMFLSLFTFIFSLGLIAPNAAASALSAQGKFAGSASALMGTIQFTVSAVSSGLVSHFHDGTTRPMTTMIFICGCCSLALYVLLVGKREALKEVTP